MEHPSPIRRSQRAMQIARNEECRIGLRSAVHNPIYSRLLPDPLLEYIWNDYLSYESDDAYFEFSPRLQRQIMHVKAWFLQDNTSSVEWWSRATCRPVYMITMTHDRELSFRTAAIAFRYFGDQSVAKHMVLVYEPEWFNHQRIRMRNPGERLTEDELVTMCSSDTSIDTIV